MRSLRVYKHTCLHHRDGQSLIGISLLQVALRRETRRFRVHRRSDFEIWQEILRRFDCNDDTDAFASADPRLDDADAGVRGAAADFPQEE